MTTTVTTNFGFPVPPADAGATTDGYATLIQAADTAVLNASGKGAWTDYSGTSTIVGWATPFTTKILKYKKVGNIVFVHFEFNGTSNSISTNFTLPYATVNPIQNISVILAGGSGSSGIGLYVVSALTSTVTCYSNMSGDDWTASGTKTIDGQFFYEVA